MVASGEFHGDITPNDGAECAALCKYTHVDVDHEQADGQQCAGSVGDDGNVAEPAQTPGNVFGEPQDQTAEEQQDTAQKEAPEQKLLPGVVAAGRGHLFVFIADSSSLSIVATWPEEGKHFGMQKCIIREQPGQQGSLMPGEFAVVRTSVGFAVE